MKSELLKHLVLIEEGVEEMGVPRQVVGEGGVDYLKHHSHHLFHNG